MEPAPKLKVLSLFDSDAVEVGSEPLRWVPVRRALGIEAFGVNAYRGDAGEAIIEEHVESPGQQELYVVLRGRMEFAVDAETVELAAGEAAFVADPSARRGGVALDASTVVLAVGGWEDRPYHSLPWEPIYLSAGPFERGEWREAVAILERESGAHRENAFVRYRLACCFAQLGDADGAMDELRAALESRPELLRRAEADELLTPLHAHDDWPPAEGS